MSSIRSANRVLAAVLVAIACAAPVLAQADSEAGEFRFKMPVGWGRAESNGFTLLIPRDLQRGRVTYIAITRGQDLTGSLRAWFDKEWGQWQREYRLLDGGKVNVQRAGNGYDTIWAEGHVADKTGKRLYILVFTASSGTRVGEFAVTSDEEVLSEAHLSGVRSFIGSLEMRGVAPGPPPASASPSTSGSGGLDGLYRTAGLVVVDTYDAVLDRMSKGPGLEHYLFYPDGRFYASYPDGGVQSFDYGAHCRRGGQFCGAYTFNGTAGGLTYRNSHTVTIDRIDDKNLLIGGKRFVRLDPCDGLILEGTFRRSDFRDQYSPKQGITFTRDGRFLDEGVTSAATVLWWTERDGYFDDDGRGGQGSYKVVRYSLELRYADGRFKRITFNLEPGAPKADVTSFVLNGWTFVRAR